MMQEVLIWCYYHLVHCTIINLPSFFYISFYLAIMLSFIAPSPRVHTTFSSPRACSASPADLASPLRQRLDQLYTTELGNGRLLIGLVGIPGSGKSTLAHTAIAGDSNPYSLIKMDGFHTPRARLSEEGLRRRGAPFTFDVKEFEKCLKLVRDGDCTTPIPTFDHSVKDPTPGKPLSPQTSIVLVEGNYLLHWPNIRELLSETWFVDVNLKLAMSRVLRRLVRDIGFDIEIAKKRVLENDGLNAKIILQSRCHADFSISSESGAVYRVTDGSLVSF